MKYTLLFIVFSFFLNPVFSQYRSQNVENTDALESLREKEMQGIVRVSMDSLIEENYNKHLLRNSKTKGVKGYRIRIFSDNGHGAKDNQKRVMASFMSYYPDISTDAEYDGAYFKVYVGNFRTKREAMLALERIDRNFPNAFIVQDNIVIDE